MGRRMHSTTADGWRERISRQRASTLSIRAWCRDNGVHEHAFYWWRKRLGDESTGLVAEGDHRSPGQAKRTSTSMGFAEVVVAPLVVPSSGEPIRLRLAGDRELILPASMPVEAMARLIRAIEGTA